MDCSLVDIVRELIVLVFVGITGVGIVAAWLGSRKK